MNSRFGRTGADPRLPRDRWVEASDHPDQPTKPPADGTGEEVIQGESPKKYGEQAVRAAIPGEPVQVIDSLDRAKLFAYAGRGFVDSLAIHPIIEPKYPSDLPPAA